MYSYAFKLYCFQFVYEMKVGSPWVTLYFPLQILLCVAIALQSPAAKQKRFAVSRVS